ncbi:MAG TPA: precorrin-2 C(20)-methyltransferase [Alphaproteobacteria bacterium]|jgi:precorrin-2/cobalt-factor-2 C20-methyltransferase|nr:precorrin-2 C(20)-methyltransferase [Alphaproteobacteria bacterium]MDP6272240.1 precorrin-2 C(20)-methyltransferase [Alphaproteobacteria bacterium]MDP7426808.1 precorrin-2 C(20)-methyltransferase [Alphaproteobacteria bacterium]HJM52126.1 precorrin-2 C(20)-methyltransferase [Alphaproteobacteria bacterium]
MSGTLYGLGIGPGDPDLITLKAHAILRAVPVIAYPAPETGSSFARDIAAPHLPGGQQEIAIRMPMVAARYPAQEIYDRAAGVIAGHLGAGRDVAVLCEGDAFFYGSFMYLFGRLVEDHKVEIVPGVSSLSAGSARLGLPLTSRNDVLTVLPGPLPADELRARIEAADAVAILKVGKHLEKIRGVLEDLGLADKARYIERATLPDERSVALGDLDPAEVPYFSLILVHKRGEAWTGEAWT